MPSVDTAGPTNGVQVGQRARDQPGRGDCAALLGDSAHAAGPYLEPSRRLQQDVRAVLSLWKGQQ